MINITEQNKVQCCGCNACGDVCAKHAITFNTDIEGFWYPIVNKDICIDCGLCEKVCPIINVDSLKHNDFEQSICHAAIHKNIEVRFDSTSGGIFSALAESMYKQGGYVGGAIFDENFFVHEYISNDKRDLPKLRSSKYLQSNSEGFYKEIKRLLVSGEKVLVCASPCQMAALRAYLRKDYDNLIIVDYICRGINSPKVFRRYLDYLEERFGAKVIYFKAKNKELGWRQLTSKIVFANKKVLYDTKDTSYFTTGYLQTGVYCRPSCYDCKFKGFPRMADITVADYWGAENTVGKDLDNDMGTSLVMINSEKGKAYFDSIKPSLIEREIPFDSIHKGNPALTKPLNPPIVNREQFYKDLDILPFIQVAEKYIVRNIDRNPSAKEKVKNAFKFLIDVKRHSGWNIYTVFKNLYWNLCKKQVYTNIWLAHYIILTKNVVFDIKPKARVNIGGKFLVGWKKFAKSTLETRILVENDALLDIKGKWTLGYGSDIEVFENAKLIVDGGGATNINATIICGEEIHIGEAVMFGRDVTVRDNNGSHYIARKGYKNTHPVSIGQHAWLCEGCTVIGGAKIGDGAICGAKSLVASHVPNFSMVAGNPAQIVDEDVYWKY